jgi:hypothetical protein
MFSASQEIPHVLRNRKVRCRTYKSLLCFVYLTRTIQRKSSHWGTPVHTDMFGKAVTVQAWTDP